MASLNKVLLIGNLGRDPEVRCTQGGTYVANMSIATKEQWTKDGKIEEKTEWHYIVAWGKLAEVCGEYLRKGSQVYFEGSIYTEIWQDKDGNDRYSTKIKAIGMQMLGGKKDAAGEAPPF